jgi:hypothetical protein
VVVLEIVFAHGIGGSQDLPISLPFALAGGSAALAASFVVLALAWRQPRFDSDSEGRPLPASLASAVSGGWLTWALRLVGLLLGLYVTWAALRGPDNLANPTFGVVYVLLWVGLVPASLLFGPFYKAVNPLRTLHLLLSWLTASDPSRGALSLPSWVGLWPASLGLLVFVWLELVSPAGTSLWTLRLAFAVYSAALLIGAAVFGDRWFAAADPFEVYSTLVGHLSPFGRTAGGVLVVRNPMVNLDSIEPRPGLVAALGVLLGSTAFDSFQDSLAWIRLLEDLDVNRLLLNSAALVVFCAGVAALFSIATSRSASTTSPKSSMPRRFAHSLVPIVVGYVIAHYLSYFVEVGQQTMVQLSDPMVDGSDLLGTADLRVTYWLSTHPTFLAFTKVGAIVGGHVLGVVAAHDRAMKVLPRHAQLTGQLPLLVVMVGFTLGGLSLLLTV